MSELPDRCQRLLRQQRGVIAAWEAKYADVSQRRMESLVRSGRWQRIQRGVYATFTGEPPRDAMLWAAVLRGGPQAIVSHETAAELYGLLDRPSKLIHISVPRSLHRQQVPGLVIHRSSRIVEARDPGWLPPRTTIEETVLDLAQAATGFDEVMALLARACRRGQTTPFLLSESLRMRPKTRWRGEIDLALKDVADGVQSVLEFRYRHDVERPHGLPAATRQQGGMAHGRAVFRDVRYGVYGVVVELDGKASHPDEQRWRDKYRDNAAAAEGLVTLRYGWADVTQRPCATASEIASVLTQRGWPGPPRRCGPACQTARFARRP